MPTATIDGITTRYEVIGDGPPLLMYAPGGFNATIETWANQGVYASGASVGAPPDAFSANGQTWCLPPPNHPVRSAIDDVKDKLDSKR